METDSVQAKRSTDESYSVETLSIMIKRVMDECKRRGWSDQQIANAIARGIKAAMDDQESAFNRGTLAGN